MKYVVVVAIPPLAWRSWMHVCIHTLFAHANDACMKRVSFIFRVERATCECVLGAGATTMRQQRQHTCHVHLVGAKHEHDFDKQISTVYTFEKRTRDIERKRKM